MVPQGVQASISWSFQKQKKQEGNNESWAAIFQGMSLPESAEMVYLGRTCIISLGISLQNWKLMGSLKEYKVMLKWEKINILATISFKG